MWAPVRFAAILVCLAIHPIESVAQNQPKYTSQARIPSAEPPAEGAYYRFQDQWVRMERLLSTGEKSKHVAALFAVPFFVPQRVLILPGVEAPIKIHEKRPTLLVKQTPSNVPQGSDRDVALVRVDKKRDHREMQVTSGNTPVTFKKTFPKDRTTPLSISRISPTTFEVTPKNDLSPGEYFLTFGTGRLGGYDFEID